MRLAVDYPYWLLALGLAPLLVLAARRSLSGLDRWRSRVALLLRLLVLTAVVLALAGARFDRESKAVNVAYLLDQSESIPAETRERMRRLVIDNIDQRRHADTGDRAAVVVFGRKAVVEYPPVDYTPALARIESSVDATATDVADAVRVADRILPRDAARRVVLVSDGNENLGAAAREAAAAAEGGLSIDVIAAPVDSSADIAVESVYAPTVASRDQPFDVRVVLANRSPSSQAAGKLRVVRRAGATEEVISESPVTLPPGKRVFTIRQEPDSADFYTYEARFVPNNPRADAHARNNVAAGFVDVRGPGRVLLIEDHSHQGEFDRLVEGLRREGLEVIVEPSNATFASLAELQRFDTVLLANLPRTSDDAGSLFATLTDPQVEMLVRNTEQMGCGLVMIGGGRALGAGGWADTALEKAMPVDFRIKNLKVMPTGALALVIDKSGSMDGEKMVLARAAAHEAIRVLGPRDYVSIVAFDDGVSSVVPIARVGDGQQARRRVQQLAASGGTNLLPGMEAARRELRKATDASARHMIVLTDGQTPPEGIEQLAARLKRDDKTTVTAVAVGPDADGRLLDAIAKRGGGKFYSVRNPRAVPRIFMREAMRVAMPVVKPLSPPRSPQRVFEHEILSGVSGGFPAISGFVQTTVKESSLVDVLLRSPEPKLAANATVLATWNYGLGKTAVFATDAGHDWANSWTGWEHYDRFFAQLVRWSMRPTGGEDDYLLTTEESGDVTRVIVDAIGDDSREAELDLATGYASGPGGESVPFTLRQTAPGRVVGEFATGAPGVYFLTVTPRVGGPTLRAGVAVSRSAEYEDKEVNVPLLTRLAEYAPPRGDAGRLVGGEAPLPFVTAAGDEAARELDPFRRDMPPVVHSQEAWPLMVLLASVLFVGDVAWRRLRINPFGFLGALRSRLRRTQVEATAPTLERLHSRKQAVREGYAAQRASDGEAPTGASPVAELKQPSGASKPRPPAQPSPSIARDKAPDEEAGYTSRLLAAKRAATKQSNDDDKKNRS
ncbi:VWA domain-containing protein [Botrimarina mediterranea]|uniref:von Willebrand factor type A domain protein n=1 Tax=Botrimarina mediterranea TaxID=2528022 RepID=A0A518K3C5_9BACT|nr:VWA domain-containing protein [Botrimarina mediterranea]QDV72301.1 von Willebrand factor type A domain protein [Botrimarina mediterranea]QDV76845.1 von Willebrand factor type A domain protein [Planctomycetes bacterium K2D]